MILKNPSSLFTLPVLLCCAVALTACGHNSQTTSSAAGQTKKAKTPKDATSVDAAAGATDSTDADPTDPVSLKGKGKAKKKTASQDDAMDSSPKCVNSIPLDETPAEWLSLDPRDLISGKEGNFQLVRIQFHGEEEAKNKDKASVTTSTVISKRSTDGDQVTQTVLCKDVSGSAHLKFIAQPVDSFAAEDGAFAQRRSIQFYAKAKTEEASVELTATKATQKFDASEEATKTLFKTPGLTYESRFYKISNSEFEARYEGTSATQTFNFAFRYRLKK